MSLSPHHIRIKIENNKLTELIIDPKQNAKSNSAIHAEIAAYFKNPKHPFKIDIELKGTAFQLKVWKALQTIPSGKTLTYGELAKKLKTSARAIGQACRTNPIPIVVPCHRVVAANGIGGFTGKRQGEMVDVKAWLLKHES